jgi:UDPglucose 6-dehydrogenase
MADGGSSHPKDNAALSWLAKDLDLSYNIFETIMEVREKQTNWLASLAIAEAGDLPIMIMGKSFKPESNITTGSPALLLKRIFEEKNVRVNIFDPNIDKEDLDLTIPRLYVIATQHSVFMRYQFAPASCVIDPFRFIPHQDGVKLISLGG